MTPGLAHTNAPEAALAEARREIRACRQRLLAAAFNARKIEWKLEREIRAWRAKGAKS